MLTSELRTPRTIGPWSRGLIGLVRQGRAAPRVGDVAAARAALGSVPAHAASPEAIEALAQLAYLDAFTGILARTVSPEEFFAPERIERLLHTAATS